LVLRIASELAMRSGELAGGMRPVALCGVHLISVQ
jgi:hypothetical protein